ncbi:MAG: hypothetical protein K8W52_10730 [Deltaproteobacteria bacterium]|nr:hypothetical protein [Deltaproteobacteria bacterium]
MRPARLPRTTAAIAAAIAMAALGCGRKAQSDGAARAVTGLAAVPSGVVAVVGFDVKRLASAPLVQRAAQQLLARRPELGERLTKLEADCQLDLTSKLDRVILASGPRAASGEQPVLLVASGQIAEASLTACLEKSVGAGGGSVTGDTEQGRTIYQVKDGRRTVFYGFGKEDTVVLGNDRAWVVKALGEGPKIQDDAEMKAFIGMSDQASPAWLAARVDAKVGQGLVRVSSGAIKAGPTAIFGALDPTDGVRAELGAVMSSEDDAKALESFAKSETGILALAAQWKGLGRAVARTEITRDRGSVKLRLALTADEVKELFSAIDSVPAETQDAHPGSVPPSP